MNANVSLEQEFGAQVARAEAMHLAVLDNTLAGFVRSDPYTTSLAAIAALHSLSRQIVPCLQTDCRFRDFSAEWFDFGNGPVSIGLIDLAIASLRVAILDGVNCAIQWLGFVGEQQEAVGFVVLAIWGAGVESRLQITPDISLWPLSEVPDSYAKRMLLGGSVNDYLPTPFDYKIPRSALLHRTLIKNLRSPPLILESPDAAETSRRVARARSEDRQRMRESLAELVLLLGVFGPQISIASVSWFTFQDPRLERLRVGATRYISSVEVVPPHIPEIPALNHTEIVPTLQAFLSLRNEVRAKLAVALERLSLAMRRHHAGDRAVELSIALESLVGDEATNEVTHKAKVRTVRMLAGDAETREKNGAIIAATYKMRSILVHQGKRPNGPITVGKEKLTPNEVTDECAKICSSLIIKIAMTGAFPDWRIFDIT